MERKSDKKILLIDDSALMRRTMSDIIKQIDGYTVVHLASDGLEGIQYLRAHTSDIDVIMTDIDMPEMDGLEATRRIRALDRADAKSVPIIAMSANTFDDDIAKSRDAGMNTHLAKPLDFDKLVKAIIQLKM